MQPSDFIGFIIAILALGFLVYRQYQQQQLLQENPDFYQELEKKRQEELDELMKTIHIEPKKKKIQKPKVSKAYLLPAPIPTHEHYQFDSKFVKADLSQAGDAYEVISVSRPSPIRLMIDRLPSKKEMILLKEVLGPPKGLQ